MNVHTQEKIAWVPTSPAARTEGHVPAPSTTELQAAGFAPTPNRPAAKKAEPKGLGVDIGGGSSPQKMSVMSGTVAEAEKKHNTATKVANAEAKSSTKVGHATPPWLLVALLIAAFAIFLSSVHEGSQFYSMKVVMDNFVASAKTAVDGAVASISGMLGAEEAKPKGRWGH